jgi:hypothetical protein
MVNAAEFDLLYDTNLFKVVRHFESMRAATRMLELSLSFTSWVGGRCTVVARPICGVVVANMIRYRGF